MKKDIIYFHQVTKPTVFSANLMYERCKELEKEINGPGVERIVKFHGGGFERFWDQVIPKP